jgi:hypothetical protein
MCLLVVLRGTDLLDSGVYDMLRFNSPKAMVSGFVFVCQEGNAQMFNVWLLIVGVSGVFMLPNANTPPSLSLASE